ncbi:MAG: nucleoside 2-deoxyribosyltransferase [Veillonella parvula]|uniref:Nucleoside 2-deoxyribosyltransferase n=1 Tax=Veillonella parvula TaxID=29466 RepID=A0A942WPN7_VEIPA|nr:nucleoside 2-deoxyribosyltransferase [Veillonella parvula]MBS4894017.1 nucleoside 2-deoxyribosyltransferase [Veillonella parvula]
MSKKKLYLAGSLFSEAEISQRIKEGNLLESLTNYDIYNPITAPCNDKEKLPTSKDIFWGDTNEVLKSEVVVADISNQNDLGVAMELGIAFMCNYIHELASEGLTLKEILDVCKNKKVYAHLSDIRKSTSHRYQGNHIPWGYNQFVVGGVEEVGDIYNNFQEVLNELI